MQSFFHRICCFLIFAFVASDASAQTIMTTVAGTGAPGYSGDGGPATAAQINGPYGIAVDAAGNLYIAERGNHRVRRVDVNTGKITTVAGSGVAGFGGDGGPATAAMLNGPGDITFDGAGNLYIADTLNNRVRKVAAGSGTISTIAGTGAAGYTGEGAATSEALNQPSGVAVTPSGILYIADTANQRVRQVVLATGVMSTAAGTGTAGYSGDGARAPGARLDNPVHLAADSVGNLYIADSGNNVIRRVAASTGLITTFVTTSAGGVGSPIGGPELAGQLVNPTGIAVDAAGNLYIADSENRRIRFMNVRTLVNSTIAGGDHCPVEASLMGTAADVAVNASGSRVYIADFTFHRIRVVTPGSVVSPKLTAIAPASAAPGTTLDVKLSGVGFESGTPAIGCISPITTISISGLNVVPLNVRVVGDAIITSTFTLAPNAAIGVRQVTVRNPGGVSNSVPFMVDPLSPSITYGLPPTLDATQQAPLQLMLQTPLPVQVSGELTLTFAPNAASPANDPSVMFISPQASTRIVGFTFPANSTTADFSLPNSVLQAGTVAGTIELAVDGLAVGGVTVAPSTLPFDVTVPRGVPVITSMRLVNRSAGGFDVEVTGYSTSKDISAASFQFSATGGANLQTVQLRPDVISQFTTYYQLPGSADAGGSFLYIQPFVAEQGDANVVSSVTLTLSNAQGDSEPKTAN